jgi:hypothetical protein
MVQGVGCRVKGTRRGARHRLLAELTERRAQVAAGGGVHAGARRQARRVRDTRSVQARRRAPLGRKLLAQRGGLHQQAGAYSRPLFSSTGALCMG